MRDPEPEFEGVIGSTYQDSTPWWPSEPDADRSRPNVVFVMLDDLGFADFGCYGSEIATPSIDQLASNGLRYNNFHTTAICSPSRACLLTGRNPHSVGIGTVIDYSAGSSGYPGYRGEITPRAATIAQMLRPLGYATIASGKWHVMPVGQAIAAGPFHNWPLQRGFDRWFGFHGGLMDQWHPELFEDNHPIDTAPCGGEHLSEMLVEYSMNAIRDLRVGSERPFFLYLAFGATHFPLQAPAANIDRYRGTYDCGWDAIRQSRFERQRRLGIIPDDTVLPDRNPEVNAWADLSADQRTLYARLQEVYAGFVEHTDAQIGRLVEFLRASGELDNTIFVVLSDNGASADGGRFGAANARSVLDATADAAADSLAEGLNLLDDLGGPRSYPHYPTGWAQASNTPLRWYKKQVHGGGIRDPLIVHWPGGISDQGAVREQYTHVIDIVPTILDALGVSEPETVEGIDQIPVEGVSFSATWANAEAPTRKEVQYFEQLGGRALWKDGWKAVTRHFEGDDFDQDVWELFHVASDFSESEDLAARHPEKVAELTELWWQEARRHQVLPLDDRQQARKAAAISHQSAKLTTFVPSMSRIDRWQVPDIGDRSFTVRASLERATAGDEGVLLSIGSRFGGCVLYIQNNHAVFEYVFNSMERYVLRSDVSVPVGSRCELVLNFERTAYRSGDASLHIDGVETARASPRRTWPVTGLDQGLHCGRDGASPVSDAYTLPFTFTGVLHHVEIDLDDPAHDAEDHAADLARLALFEQ